jgi:hypothetical protein
MAHMAARAEGVPFPTAVVRWVLSSGTITAIFAAAATLIRQRLEHISVPPMSEEWLLNHERDTHDRM